MSPRGVVLLPLCTSSPLQNAAQSSRLALNGPELVARPLGLIRVSLMVASILQGDGWPRWTMRSPFFAFRFDH